MYMVINRAIFHIVRNYSKLCLIIIILWIFIHSFQIRFESSPPIPINSNDSSNDLYSYFKAKSSNTYKTSTNISIHDVLLVIRTSKNSQAIRMPVILKTWFEFSPDTTYITTNGNVTFFHRYLSKQYHHQIHSTNCQQAHSIRDLCCHSASEFEIYFRQENKYKWLCRFDDDQYVNVPLLIDYLKQFDPDKQALYIGKPSMKEPKRGRSFQFWFGTYGGGICFSRLLLKMVHDDVQPNNQFMEGCISSNYPDDTHIAYILRKKYNINLTVANDFHHHIERDLFTNLTNPINIDQAITLGFKGNNVPRFIPLVDNDRFHMQTLHCLLYPDRNCMRLLRILLNKLYKGK
jgi:fringe protein